MDENILLSVDRSSELYHHGIQGQKWGVQNGPPYPLDRSISTGKSLKNNKELGDAALVAILAYDTIFIASMVAEIIKTVVDEKKYGGDNLNQAQEQYSIKFKDRKNRSKQAQEIEKCIKEKKDIPESLKRDPNKDMTKEELKYVNEQPKNYAKAKYLGRARNCTCCSTSYILNRKGYKVQAGERYIGNDDDFIDKCFKNVEKNDFQSSKSLYTYLENKPDGSYGTVTFWYKTSGGHAMNWKKSDGKVSMIDTQPSRTNEMSYKTWEKLYDPNFSAIGTGTVDKKSGVIANAGVHATDMTNSTVNWNEVIDKNITR